MTGRDCLAMVREAIEALSDDQVRTIVETVWTWKTGVPPSGSVRYGQQYRSHPVSNALGAITAQPAQALLFSGWFKQNGSTGSETAPHPLSDPLGTLTGRDTTAVLAAEWRAMLADLRLEDCYFRMMAAHEIGRGCGFDVDFVEHKGTFIVWGSDRDQTDGFGNAVSPAVGTWAGSRLRAALHGEVAA
ncbi:hypothetical protein [Mycolicibacterium llatzerense]|uniref:hypothetical protein n=1 Tax=Mycolicibacterium llatzerense TaxID=280871 RepID=UPI0021B56F18|nr:hypothetical protein [Mycolicibacterium llatzerense]MCT7361328.1 hypothetical protein [Mycolicibacterium llatzerense]